ncbi:DedA family protein [Nitratireductor basaltis]|uniref:DedA family protein n=1 Tax=Nitratireductor basaltis TaxID=472175 RepID=UPI00056BD233|nr:VTT domain-containing protein [Nitratireductor basaltis]
MTEIVLGLIPVYGLFVIFVIVFLACTGIPMPSSIVVLTAGALAAAGDLVLWRVLLVVICAYLLGDQITYNAGRIWGPGLIARLRRVKRLRPAIERSETLLQKHGLLAIFISRTILSQAGPYVGYVSGSLEMGWRTFTAIAVPAAILWTLAYALLGYIFAGELPQVSDLVAAMLLVGAASLSALAFAVWIALLWRRFEPSSDEEAISTGIAQE